MDAVPPARIRNIVEESQTSLGPSNVVDYRASVIQVDRKSAISPIRLVDHILWGIMKIRESFEERPQEMILPMASKARSFLALPIMDPGPLAVIVGAQDRSDPQRERNRNCGMASWFHCISGDVRAKP
ncbi:hypothetical protein BGY98DRAFT_936798 [Russula aff. rugulosa BPL654]|nr:hypothetical protein BGY98DRAFT_936798 [Russula aff. rugulosa BPL654]